MSQLVNLLPLVGIALIFWLLLLRPAQRQRKEVASMQAALGVGDEVILTSGVYGTLRSLGDEVDDSVSLEVSPGIHLRVARAAIGAVVNPTSALEDSATVEGRTALDDPAAPGTTTPDGGER